MKVSDIEFRCLGDKMRLSAQLTPESQPHSPFEMYLTFSGLETCPPVSGDPFAAALLIPCMYAREDLHIEGTVSTSLLAGLYRIRDVMEGWYPGKFADIQVSCAEQSSKKHDKSGRGVGCCFSGGVDSWHSVLTHKDDLTHLLLVRGFDIYSDRLWKQTFDRQKAAAEALGLTLITVDTNIRQVGDMRQCSWAKPCQDDFWGPHYCGSAVAAIVLCLQDRLHRFIIPSGYSYEQLFICGAHPKVEPCYSTDNIKIEYDYCEYSRMGKVRKTVSKSPLALKTLRVCYHRVPGKYNCCNCEKCLRTMAELRVCGVLDKAETFERPLNLVKIKRMPVSTAGYIMSLEVLAEAEAAGDHALAEAFRIALGKKFSMARFSHYAGKYLARKLRRYTPRRVAAGIRRRLVGAR